jgi:hypothetical protein
MKKDYTFNHKCLYSCRISNIKVKNKTPNTIRLSPVGLLMHSYFAYASVLNYFKTLREGRAKRQLALTSLDNICKYTGSTSRQKLKQL